MYRNQIDLGRRKLEKNISFTVYLHSGNLEDACSNFDFLDSSCIRRQPETEMDIEKFTKLMEKGIYTAKLDIGSVRLEGIRHVVVVDDEFIHRFAWLECPYNEKNLSELGRIFKKAFGQKMESIPIPEYLQEHHKKLEKYYGKKHQMP